MVRAIVGANWGDEGKGKITDVLAQKSDMVIRFQGGSNAGHTIINHYGKFALHQLPSGVFNTEITNIIGNGVALSVENLVKEIQELLDNLSASAGYDKGSQFIEPDRPGTGKKKSSGTKKKDGEKSLEELLNDLNSLIGLEEVKYDVTSLINLVRIRDIREKMGLEMPPISLHLVFSGNPGTGKTTVARLLAEIYHKIGILSKGQLVEVDRSGMVAGYVGQTALKVQDVIKQALGGVLFIDEAYALTPENPSNDYGLEAIDTLVKSMEDHRDDLRRS